MYNEIYEQTKAAAVALLAAARLKRGDIFLVGCSTSEVQGAKIGSLPRSDEGEAVRIAEAVYGGLAEALAGLGVYLAAQCCEHLNRAVILDEEAALLYRHEIVNAVPKPKAGGAFAARVYHSLACPAAVECVKAKAGMDIGGVLIGMNLAAVAVPVRLDIKYIGSAPLICARTRPKFIGGDRAEYDERLK